jgi:putative phage-type endonuclease
MGMMLSLCALECHGLAAIGRQKRRQRGLAQQGQPKAPMIAENMATAVVVVAQEGGEQQQEEDDEEKQEAARERLWGMAGQTSRRKRRRGRLSTRELRDDDDDPVAVPYYYSDPSTTPKVRVEAPDPSTLVQPKDIESVQVILPTITDDSTTSTPILADVTFINGTTIRVNPQELHQRQDNAVWMALRKQAANVTASELSAIAGNSVFTTREKLALVKAGLLETTFTGNLKACAWGLKMEPKALRQYCQVTKNAVQETGLHIRSLLLEETAAPLLVGASPDGLVVDAKDGSSGLLEIKCLWGRRHKKELPKFDHCPQRFFDQIQGQLAVCDLEWCDLMMYIPPQNTKTRRVGAQKNYCILRVQRDRAYWSGTLLPAVQSFCVEVEQLLLHPPEENVLHTDESSSCEE